MGKYFILLILAIIVVMGVLGWLVLRGDQNLGGSFVASNAYAEDRPMDRRQRETGRQRKVYEQDEAKAESSTPETQEELLRRANDLRASNRLEAVLKLIDVEQERSILVPALAKLLLDHDELVRNAAGVVLNKIGPEGAEYLRVMMESDVRSDNALACTALKEMGGAHLYLPQLRKWLSSDDSDTRRMGLFPLQSSQEGVLEVIDEVKNTLSDKDFQVALAACRALIKLGPDGLDAAPELLELHKNGIPSSKGMAAWALGAIGPSTEFDTAKYLAGTLDAFMQMEKQRSLKGLALMGPEAISVAEEVREVMRDSQKRVMPDAAYTLWRITGETEEPIKVLSAALQHPDYVDTTIELVGGMGEAAKPLVGLISEAMTIGEAGLQEIAVMALGNIGPSAAEAIPAIRAIADNPDFDALLRFYAKEAIEKIEAVDQKPKK